MFKYKEETPQFPAMIVGHSATPARFAEEPNIADGQAMARGLDVVMNIERFRNLRLFHYQEALRCTASINEAEARMQGLDRRFDNDNITYNRLSDRVSLFAALHGGHMTHVQTLNILFPVGDNVEGDMPQ